MIDKDIIQACIERSEKASRKVYENSISYIYSLVKLYLKDEEIRKDIVQEIYASIFSKLAQFNPERGEFKFWIRKIAINHCVMYLRKEIRSIPVIPLTNTTVITGKQDINIDELSRQEIEMMLSNMPSGYRTVFLLIVFEGYDHEEVSTLLNISKETSRSQLSRAKSWIRKTFFSPENINANGTFL